MLTEKQNNADLLDFLTDWLAWTKNPLYHSPLGFQYSTSIGLCSNAWTFDYIKPTERYYETNVYKTLEILITALGNGIFPFGSVNYDLHRENNSQHQDPTRLAWVRETIKRLEDEA